MRECARAAALVTGSRGWLGREVARCQQAHVVAGASFRILVDAKVAPSNVYSRLPSSRPDGLKRLAGDIGHPICSGSNALETAFLPQRTHLPTARPAACFARLSDQYIIVLNINTISGSCLHPE